MEEKTQVESDNEILTAELGKALVEAARLRQTISEYEKEVDRLNTLLAEAKDMEYLRNQLDVSEDTDD
jgi:F0F1-type ATP synthase delta subunit